MTFANAGRKYSVSAECVRQLTRRFQATGEIQPRPPINHVAPYHQKHEVAIRAAVAEHPGFTLAQLRTKLGLDVSITTLWNARQQLRITFKKRFTPPNRSGPMSSCHEPSSTAFAWPASTRIA